MIRKAFRMEVFPDRHEEYEKRHNPIWPELHETLKSHGVHNYSIFLHAETNQLFAYVELDSEEQWNKLAETESCRKWWGYMKDIMATNPDNSPKSEELKQVFHIE